LALALVVLQTAFSQDQYQVLSERPNEKTYKGIISRQVLMADTSFKWYAENLKPYTPNADAVAALKKMLIPFNCSYLWAPGARILIISFLNFIH
jgi:hypothetical protein